MRIRRIESETMVGGGRGDAVICLMARPHMPPWASLPQLISHTPPSVPILICGGQYDELEAAVSDLDEPRELGWLADSGQAAAWAAPADVVIVAGGCSVGEHWFDQLRAAAYADAGTATASALDQAAVSAGGVRVGASADGIISAAGTANAAAEIENAAAAVAAASLRLRPRLRAPTGPCYYIRRSALELAGPLGPDFSARCVQIGLAHVLADDVLVRATDSVSRPGPTAPETTSTPLQRAIGIARRALNGLRVTIDARELRGPVSGWHVAAIELVGALADTENLHLQVLLGPDPTPEATDALSNLTGITVVHDLDYAQPSDVVHRPFQVSTPADLAICAALGERLLITHHDLISYHNPSYFRDHDAWRGYRELTQAALAIADGIVFGSTHARDEALAEELVDPWRTSVVPHGVDHRALRAPHPVVPAGLGQIDAPMLLCLGTDLRHKNRLFALRLLEELHQHHGWHGRLVLAGPTTATGSSREAERLFLDEHPGLSELVVLLGAVSEAEKQWLLERASLVVYPTLHEGFGLVPFEAAEHGTPCLWAAGSALSETLPPQEAMIEPWDTRVTARRAVELMSDEAARERHVQAVCESAQRLRWQDSAAALLEVYRRTADGPPSPAGMRERTRGFLRGGLSEDAMRLVGPDGALPPELERPLLALATRRRIATPVFRAIQVGYRFSRRSKLR